MCDYRWATHQQSPAGTYWPEYGLICLPLSLGGQQHRTHSSTDKVGKGCYENKDYLCRKDLDIMMSLFNQVLALPASQEPRTISSSQLCQNTALRPRRTQTRLEQQTPSAHTSSQYLQLLPQLSQGREEQLPGRAGWRVILVGWAASTAPFRRNRALTLSWGSVCFLQGWRGSTQGRKVLKWGTRTCEVEELGWRFSCKEQCFLGRRWSNPEMKGQIRSFHAAAPPFPPDTVLLYGYFCADLCRQQLAAGSPPVYKVQQTRLIQFFPTANQAEHSKQQLPSRPHCTLTCLTFSTIPKEPQKRFLLFPDWCLEWHNPLSQSLIYTMCVTKDIVFIDPQYRMIKQQFHNQHFFVQGNKIVFPVQYVNTEI